MVEISLSLVEMFMIFKYIIFNKIGRRHDNELDQSDAFSSNGDVVVYFYCFGRHRQKHMVERCFDNLGGISNHHLYCRPFYKEIGSFKRYKGQADNNLLALFLPFLVVLF